MTLDLLMRYLIWPLVKFLVAFIIVQVIVAAMNWVERRLLGLVQARLGHASIVMTLDTYGHLFPRGDDGAELAAAEKALLA